MILHVGDAAIKRSVNLDGYIEWYIQVHSLVKCVELCDIFHNHKVQLALVNRWVLLLD